MKLPEIRTLNSIKNHGLNLIQCIEIPTKIPDLSRTSIISKFTGKNSSRTNLPYNVFKCQRHTSTRVCVKCVGLHDSRTCTKTFEISSTCANCKRNHPLQHPLTPIDNSPDLTEQLDQLKSADLNLLRIITLIQKYYTTNILICTNNLDRVKATIQIKIATLNIILWNATSVKNKTTELHKFLTDYNTDITKTFKLNSYNIYRNDRPLTISKNTRGGVLIAARKDIQIEDIPQLIFSNIEFISIRLKSIPLLIIGAAYISPKVKIIHSIYITLSHHPTPVTSSSAEI
ncbi:unnamed protein product [Heterotrigona itama]|uniref:Uncharacterized protein n=1 Tax=Heterotrigona itama TaxID=395501 RepID=A0A6V7HBN1_9HYME|nr:unnamed protein product [Heterotrigona itama]